MAGSSQYWEFLREAGLIDETSKFLSTVELQNLFILCNQEDSPTTSLEAEVNSINPDRELMRFEFLRALTRIGVAKYIKEPPRNSRDVTKLFAPHEAVERSNMRPRHNPHF